jgi:predicted esterase
MAPSASQPALNLPPLVVAPKATHKTTLIVLHGRGSTAEKFAEPLLTNPVSPSSSTAENSNSFHDQFPNTKFIFPTAPLRRAVIFQRSLTHQWFDNWSLTETELKEHLQIPGLRETSAYLHNLLETEIGDVGAQNVVLMGLSQGCAASIVAALLWEGKAFGALVGMCGYLPFRKGMCNAMEDEEDDDEDSLVGSDDNEEEDMFERDSEEADERTKFGRAIEWLREELQTPQSDVEKKVPPIQSIPIFMGHGAEDEKVPCDIGRSAAEFLGELDVTVTWEEYHELGHWYSADMLWDITQFLRSLKGWEVTDNTAA